jgi:hypothetical protein
VTPEKVEMALYFIRRYEYNMNRRENLIWARWLIR